MPKPSNLKSFHYSFIPVNHKKVSRIGRFPSLGRPISFGSKEQYKRQLTRKRGCSETVFPNISIRFPEAYHNERNLLEYSYRLEDTLRWMAEQGKRHFSPHYVCAQSGGTDIKVVSEYLLSEVGRKLVVYYEVECPEGDSDFTIKSDLELKQEKRSCQICGIEYIPSLNRIWIAFDFLPQYIDYVKSRRVILEGLP